MYYIYRFMAWNKWRKNFKGSLSYTIKALFIEGTSMSLEMYVASYLIKTRLSRFLKNAEKVITGRKVK